MRLSRHWSPPMPGATIVNSISSTPSGRIAAHTGSACIAWNGHIHGDGFSIAGNMLARPRVLDDTAAAYLANAALPFPRRLIAAMRAGEAAGGDKRGKQSAALLIYGEEEWSDLDLRVDDHRRAACRAAAARKHKPGALDGIPALFCQTAAIPWASPTAA